MKRRVLAGALLAVIATACRAQTSAPQPGSVIVLRMASGRTLRGIPFPDLSHAEPAVRDQITRQFTALTNTAITTPQDADVGTAAGEMGRLFLAAEFVESAQACFQDAADLAPGDMRWPYYLGHLYEQQGKPDRAAASLERALRLRPNDTATLISLGRVYLEQGASAQARDAFASALKAAAGSPAALAGLGRAALADRQYTEAAAYLEQALAKDPDASALHYSLAQAYRGQGFQQKADAELARRGTVDVSLADPLMDGLDEVLESPIAYQRRGVRALNDREWQNAAALFRHAIALANNDPKLRPVLRHKLGTALLLGGDSRAAIDQFRQVASEAPDYAPNHYSLAVSLAGGGDDRGAIAELRTAVHEAPDWVEAHVALADALRRTGQLEASREEYDAALRLDDSVADAHFGRAMASVALGRLGDAAALLDQGIRRCPDDLRFPHALARVLATAADPQIRDGRRALALTSEVERREGLNAELGETRAMALAELRRFDDAIGWQRQVLAAFRRSRDAKASAEAARILALYEHHQPNRTPWPDDSPVFHPAPAIQP